MKIRSVLFFIAISIVTTLISGSASADPLSIEVTNNPTSVFACHAVDGVVTAEGGSPPYSFSISGAPAGITLSDEDEESHSVNIQGSTTRTETFNISITVEDEGGETETTTFTLTVKPNTSPTITNPGNKTFETGENTGKEITQFTISVSDTEDTPTVTVSGLPSGLTASSTTAPVTVSGTLPADVSGTSTVTVTANDGCNTAVTETFEIKVDVNSAPTVTSPGNKSYFQCETITPFTITVRDEDDTPAVTVGTLTIPPGISYSESSSSYGTGGAEITYTFSGTVDSDASPEGFYIIGVSANDGTNTAVSGGLRFTVKENTPPEITNPGNKFFVTGETVGKDITPFSISVSDAEDNPTVTVSGLPSDLSYNPDTGQVSGTLDAGLSTQTYNVTVTADDDCNDPVTETFHLSVILNRAPVISNPGNKTFVTGENTGKDITPFSFSVARVDDAITVTVSGLPSDLSANYDTNTQQVTVSGELDANASGTSTVTVTADDDCNDPVTETFTITVNVNEAPDITNPGNKSYFQCETITSFDIDVSDAEDTPSVTVSGLPSGLSYSNGQISGEVDANASARNYTVTITANDGFNTAVTETFTITVKDNTSPVITNPGNKSYFQCETITSFDIDVSDAEDTPSVTVSGLPSGLSYSNGQISGEVDANASARNYTVTIRANDSCNPVVTRTFTITVKDNTSPVISNPGNKSYFQCETITSFDIDVSDAEDTPSVTVSGLPSGLSYSNGQISGEVDANASARNYTVTIRANDSCNPVVTRTFTITVKDNTSPVITDPGNKSYFQCETITSFDIDVSDAEDTPSVTVSGLPSGLSYSNGQISGEVDANASARNYTVTIRANDSCNPVVTRTFTITVKDNTSPVISNPGNKSYFQCETITSFDIDVSDAEDTPSVTVSGLPSGLSYSNGQISGEVDANASARNYTVTIRANDSCNPVVTRTFTITVKDNTSPVITDPGNKTFKVGENKDIAITPFSISVTDAEDNPTVSVSGLPSGLSYSNGQIRGTLPKNRSANATVTIRADDGCNPAVTETFTITVNVNRKPVITGASFQSYLQCEVIDPFTITVSDSEDTPTVTVSSLPSSRGLPDGLTYNYNSSNGKVVFSGTVDADASTGDYIVQIAADDGCNTAVTSAFRIVIQDNTPPVITDPGDKTFKVGENKSLTISPISISVTDAEDNPTVTVSGLPSGLSYNSSNGQISGTLPKNRSANATVTIRAADGCNPAVTETFTITVNVNQAPVITDPGNKTFETGKDRGKAITAFSISVTDAEDTPTVSVSGLPSGLSYNSSNGQVSGTLPKNRSANATVTIRADDGCNPAVTETFTITVNVNNPPVITDPGKKSYYRSEAASFDITVTDAEDTPTVRVSNLPPGLNYSNGRVSGTVASTALVQDYIVTITADDDCNSAVTETFTITINNRAPTFNEGTSTTRSFAENTTGITNIGDKVVAADPDGDTLEYSLEGTDKESFSINSGSGQLQTKTNETYNYEAKNSYSVTVKVVDGHEGSDAITVTVSLTDVLEPPGKPAAPTVPTATLNSLTVNWTAPENTGPPIKDYNVQYRKGSSGGFTPWTHSGTGTSTTLTGLESDTTYEIQVQATNDEGTGDWSDSGSGTTIANAGPVFISLPAFSLEENSTTTVTVTATDSDAEDNIEGYTLTGGVDKALFGITNAGVLSFNNAPNFENPLDVISTSPSNAATNNEYVVVVTATSGTGDRKLTADQTIIVTVTDDETEAPGKPAVPTVSNPTSNSLPVTWTVPTNTGPPITDYNVQYRIKDSGDNFTDAQYDGTTLTTTITGLDPNTTYEVQVQAANAEGTGDWSDSGSGTTMPPPAGPAFTSNAAFDVAENTTSVGTVVAEDADAEDDIEGYAISGGVDKALFGITNAGVLSFNNAPNFENPLDVVSTSPSNAATNNEYVVVVTATSGTGDRKLTADQTIIVTVTDDETEAPGKPAVPTVSNPTSNSLPVTWTVPTNTGPPITDYNVQYRIKDSGDNFTDAQYDGTTLTTTITGLDPNTTYEVQVQATNAEGTGDWSDSGSGTTMPPPAGPSFTSNAAFDVAENTTSVGTVVAEDADAEDNIEGYAISGGVDKALFGITNAGVLSFNNAPNFENPLDVVSTSPSNAATNNEYVVVVTATSGTGDRKLTADQTIIVTVTDDETEVPGKPAAPTVSNPTSNSLPVTWTVPTNTGPPITDYNVQYRIKDSGDNFTDAQYDGTGLTTTLTGLESDTTYEIQVQASNAEGTGDWSDSGSGTTTTGGDNQSPVFTSASAFSLEENSTTTVTVTATDSDAEDNIEGYAISGGVDKALFGITNAGVLSFNNAPNFENPLDVVSTSPSNAATNNEYVVVVTATSGTGDRALTSDQTLTITVTNVDEAGVVTFSESNIRVGSALTATLTDPDGGVTGETWEWARSADKTTWTTITGATSGSYTPVLDDADNYLRATVSSYTDGEGSGKSAQAVTDNTVGTSSIAGPGNITFEENTTLEVGGTYTYTETFPESATLTWSVTGDLVDCFLIIRDGRNKGKLIIGFAAKNYEDPKDANMDNVYMGRVQVSDGVDANGSPDTAIDHFLDVVITVTNVDEAGVVTFSESDIQVGSALTATVTDPDGGVTGEMWQWARSSDKTTWTTITGATSGSYIPVLGDADNYLRATVSYTDAGGSGKSAQAVTANMVETPPIAGPENITFEENTTLEVGGTYTYTETFPESATLTWSVTGDLDGCFFIVGEGRKKGNLTIGLTAKDYEDPKDANMDNVYMGRVQVSDGVDANGNPDTTIDHFLDVVITVTDVNEGPVFSSAMTFEVVENEQSVGTVVAEDEDSEDSITGYTITGGVDKDQFAIDASTGELTFNAVPDFENPSDVMSTTPSNAATNNEYIVVVTATSGTGDRLLTKDQTITITVTDENEGPVFSSAMTFEVAENEQSISTVVAEDVDSEDSIESYAITGGADQAQFAIDASTGELTFNAAPDFENPLDVISTSPSNAATNNEYIVVVTATSGTGDRLLTKDQTLTITVTNVDEAGVVTFSESADIEIDVALTATLTDPDGGVTGEVWKWARSSDKTTWTTITGATSGSYTPVLDDADNYLRATVSYTDAGGSGKSAQAVTANMVRTPPITGEVNITVEENTTLEVVGTYTYTETFPENATLTWSVTGDLDGCFFIVGEGRKKGNLTIGLAAKDYEDPKDANMDNVYMGRVQVSDGVDANGDADTTIDHFLDVVITVTNVDEAGVVTFSESDIRVGSALTATLTDPDGSVTGEVWQWARSSDKTTWTTITGATSGSYTPVLDDADNYLRATVSYTDGVGSGKSAQAVIDNMVRTPPIVGPGTIAVEENTTLEAIGTYTYTKTFPENATLTWSVTGDLDGCFFIAGEGRKKGNLTIGLAAKDYEDPKDANMDNVYMGRVQVSDGVDTNGNPDTAIDHFLDVVITVTDVNEVPGVPDPPTVVVSSNRLNVSWTEPSNTGPAITDYDVQYRQMDSEDSFIEWNSTNTSTDLMTSITGIMSDTHYEVQVRATNDEGTGDWSNSGFSLQPPAIPTLSRVIRGNGEALLIWQEASNNAVVIDKYQYRQREDGGTWSDWEDIPESETSTSTTLVYPLRHLVTGLTNGTTYHFQVRAVNGGGESDASNSKTATPAQVPHIMSNFAVEAGNGQVTFSWTNPDDNTIIWYQYSQKKGEGTWVNNIRVSSLDYFNQDTPKTIRHTVTGLENGVQYIFILEAVSSVGAGPPTQWVYATPRAASSKPALSDAVEFVSDVPDTFSIAQNYPNPFNPETTIPYALPQSVHVRLVIYNVLGQEIRTLVNEMKPAGYYRVVWDNKDDFGKSVSSGIYLYRIVAGDFVETKKLLLLK